MGSFEEDFAQTVSTVSTLRAILDGYPLSAGILKEILANSNDAGATKQIFVLDRREHSTEGLYNEGLSSSQGPAFMAFNDAVLRPQDWKALRSIHESSKVVDESKIGKYGVGFRSVFNLSDSPQILSDIYLAIFDPLCRHFEKGGKKIDLPHVLSTFPNQLLPFSFFTKDGLVSPFQGTIIRCPLRTAPSGISDQVVQPEVICELFKEFIDQELEISCLFLDNIKCIEIYEVASTGISTLLAKLTISRSDPHCTMFKATVEIERNRETQRKEWQLIQKYFSLDEAVNILLQQPGYNRITVTRTLQGAKYSPEVQIAVDITNSIRGSDITNRNTGRLFTYLPLPIFTDFPVHIHSLFGIDTSRAHLRRANAGLMSGSQDHVKVQWNKMLFQTFIPRAWSHLLEEMVSKRLVSDVFRIWPPERSSGELESYYPPLSGQLVNDLLAAKAAVWPVYEFQDQSPPFGSLEALVVVSPTEREGVLQALARVGLSLTRPPRYIFELLSSSKNVSILDPDLAHRLLQEKADKITEKDRRLLLEYMLSTKNVLNICNLPLVLVANGEKATISSAPGFPIYTILTRPEFDIFGLCDDSAIHLHLLPRQVADTLLEFGPRSINVRRLTVSRIADYLATYSTRLNSGLSESGMEPSTIRWLSNFWEWMNSYEQKDELFPRIRQLPLLPSTKGLRTAESAIFKLRGEHHAYTMGYLAFGVPFLPREFSEAAHDVVRHYGKAKLISDIPALLDSMGSTSPSRLKQPDYESILKHLASRLDKSNSKANIQDLRNLPVFPLLASTNSSGVVTNWTAIPAGHSIRSVDIRSRFIPVIDGVSFIGLKDIAPALVEFLEPSQTNPMSENDLIELAVDHFTTQPEYLQLALLRHITANRTRIIQDIIIKLSLQAFVLAEDGEHHVPGEIVDPDSDLGQLYVGCPTHLPSKSSSCVEVMRCLKSLKLLRAQLNVEIVAERVEYISLSHTSDKTLSTARTLLPLLGSSNIDFSKVQGIAEKKWLPTNRGLCSADECRHAVLTPLALFDKVLGILEPFTISPPLQTALRWDKPLPVDLLIRQLDHSLLSSEHSYDAVVEIVKEFGRREWSDEDFDLLKRTVRDREWIPTVGEVLADAKSSVFNYSPAMLNSGFYHIRTDLKAENLLRRMGCTDCPSTRVILDKLNMLNQDSNHIDLVATSISLLRSLPDEIATEERAELLIPDKDSQLRPFSEIFYNDIGENHRLVKGDGHFIVHPSLDESLMRKLGLNRLGLKYAELRNVGPNMGQAPITTVTRTLREYTSQQFLLEFLANAEDAKAKEFTVALNLTTVPDGQSLDVLDPAMGYLCRLPSLVVHNSALFTPQDFDGICHTNVGGKEGRSDTIGEFGLGVLTMYHFTDLAMVISGSRVLFLDPSQKHLPRTDRAALILELEYVQRFYKDHLVVIDGLFDFNMSLESYHGTLFILPLRVSEGTNHPIIPDFWPTQRIVSEILDPFRAYAGDCLLFTGIETISCITRTAEGVVTPLWTFRAQKTPVVGSETDSEYVVMDIEITKSETTDSTAHWKTVTTSRTKDRLPLEFQGESSLLRKPSSAGLAVRLDRSSDGHSFNFFSALPLSTPTTLPMHVMASFKLSSDRRQIRLDKYEGPITKYNTWLLKELIPPLYLFFLEHLLHSDDEHYRLRWPSDKGDTLSNHVVDSFYSSLKVSKRKLFTGLYSRSPLRTQSPQDAVLYSSDIRHILDRLEPHQVVDLPSGPRELAQLAGLRTVDPDFVKNEIICNPGAITSVGNFQLILDVILYLARDSSDILHGLPILPLEDGNFGTLDTRRTGSTYYWWRPKNDQAKHNFDGAYFVHPGMKTKELERYKINVFRLSRSIIKRFVAAKLSTFSEHDTPTRNKWIDSFWDSWAEYTHLELTREDIAPFQLVPTTLPSYVSLDDCEKGGVFLVEGDSQENRNLRVCFRSLGLPVVHVDSAQFPEALRQILKNQVTSSLKLGNVIAAMVTRRSEVPMQDLFGSINGDVRNQFAEWARKNITDIPKEQIPFARTLPIWPSAGGGASQALRPASEVQLLPKNVTLQEAAAFMADFVAEDTSLTNLDVKHMSFDELSRLLRPPGALDSDALNHYKQFYEHCASDCRRQLPVPTSANTFQDAKDLFKREPLFTAVFPADSSLFVHPQFEDLVESRLQSEDRLDMGVFKTCADKLDANDPTAVHPAREVFRAFRDILPTRVINKPDTWRELDEISFIPRRMDTVRKLPDFDENEPGLEIPLQVTCLDAIVSPVELVKEEFEAIAWSQRACFEVQPGLSVCAQYADLGVPSFSEVMAHLRYLSNLTDATASQRRTLIHDVKKVYKHFTDNLGRLKENKELADTILSKLRNEPLFLNIDGAEERLNWVKGGSLVIGGPSHHREGTIQGVRASLRVFEEILEAAGALTVHHPTYIRHSEAGISSSFDRLRRENTLTDVVFKVRPTEDVPNPEPLFAHRTFLAVSSEYFRNDLCADTEESRNTSTGCPLTINVDYSWQCVRSFLDHVYTRDKGGREFSLELLLEILDISNAYQVMDLFDEVQGEIIERQLLRPGTVDKIRVEAEKQQAKGLVDACAQYESANTELIRQSRGIAQISDV